jgi:hypothetical protein
MIGGGTAGTYPVTADSFTRASEVTMAIRSQLISEDLVLIDDRLSQLKAEYLPRIPTETLIVVAALGVLIAQVSGLRAELREKTDS